ncbi:hypothetical protein QJS10_CPA08g00049 [Acorus calamus]|uniref:Uncharacterized protein n=1 Tax=Acorus calamus TaxID=4465 RepID=A0AAV9EDE7_ACOCL|nr:hypothetical protein QJS10_CPA08g00049 [Acorus calamus]
MRLNIIFQDISNDHWQWRKSSEAVEQTGLSSRLLETVSGRSALVFHRRQPTLVSEMLGTKYHWNGNPWEFHIPQRAAAIWRALCMGLRALRTHVRKVAAPVSDNTKPTQWVWDESPYLTPHLNEVYYLLLPSPFAADTQRILIEYWGWVIGAGRGQPPYVQRLKLFGLDCIKHGLPN